MNGDPRAYTMSVARRYVPAVAFFLGIALIIALVPSTPGTKLEQTVDGSGSSAPAADGSGGIGASGTDPVPGSAPTGAGGAAGTGAGGGAAITGGPTGGAPDTPASGVARSGVRCSGGVRQVTWSKYAPTCVPAWTGDNGGATAPGVTRTTITLAYRLSNATQAAILDAAIPGLVPPDPEYVEDLKTYASLFNKTFELYGRKVVIKAFRGQGDWLQEHQGQNLQGAQADAATEREIGAFADITQLIEVSVAYTRALAHEKVISLGNIGGSQALYADNAPYAYNLIPTSEDEGGWGSGLVCRRLWGMPAIFAGDATYKKSKRVLGLVGGDGPDYRKVGNTMLTRMKADCGATVVRRVNYTLNIATYQQQAPSIIAQMKAAGVTTLFLFPADYVMIQALMQQADQQRYNPEWVILNAGDAGARTPSQNQMAHAIATDDFYLATLGVKPSASEAYKAFKLANPKGEPAQYAYNQPYYALLRAVAAMQLAGPNLTPGTFQRAMFSLPPSAPGGDTGTWTFARSRFAPQVDSAVTLFRPDATSAYDGRRGSFLACDGDKKYSFANEDGWGARRQLRC